MKKLGTMRVIDANTGETIRNNADRRCGLCGIDVAKGKGNRKGDGWLWHFECWKRFLVPKRPKEERDDYED